MKKYKCKVTRVDEYEIEFDETKCNEAWMADFRSVFFNFHDLEEHAEQIAQMRARYGADFIEGYGNILQNGAIPTSCMLTELNEANHDININIISEDEDCEVEVEEI
jgi:hypothetical protein